MAAGSEFLLASVRQATEGEYTIDGELGRGGMAVVYLARDIALDRKVAIKVMLPDLVDVAGIADRFMIEARTAAHLDHPGIVTVYSVKKRNELLFIVMKYVAGRTLESVLTDSREIPMSVATSIVGQVAEALQFAHGEGVVHRDVKPSNVLIDVRGRPVITDFGIAKVTAATSITVTGALIGTPAYMSPEQCRGLPATAASDQYSLGVLAYEMLARRLPFTGTLFELIHAHCDAPPAPLADVCPGVDPVVHEAVTRMLSKNPRDRWPSLAEVARVFTHDMSHGRGSTEIRADIAAMAREDAQDASSQRRKAIAYDISGQATEQVTTPAPALVITPQDPAIEVGASVALRVSESSGASLAGIRIEWRSEDASVATVDSAGRVVGVSVGLAKITASGGAALGRATVTVRATAVDTLVVTPQNPEIEADSELQLVVTALDARGNVMPRQNVVWVSSDVALCAVSQTGRVIGLAPGRATVTAQVADVSGSATVKVRPQAVLRVVVNPGELNIESEEKRPVSAAVFGAADRVLKGRVVRWRSSVPNVANVTDDGIVEGAEPGTAAIIGSCDGTEGICSVVVRSQPIVAVRIQPARLQLEVGRSLQLQGVAEDRRGRAVHGRGLEWYSDDDRIAMVDASGKVHAASAGRTAVRAVANGVESSIDVMVVPRPVARVQIATHEPSLVVGAHGQLDVSLFDAEGTLLKDRGVEWSSSDPKVVAVYPNGSLVAKRPGSVRITAICGTVRAVTALKVVAAHPAHPAAPPESVAGARPRGSGQSDRPVPAAAGDPRPSKRVRVLAGVVGVVGVVALVAGTWYWVTIRGADAPQQAAAPVQVGSMQPAPPGAQPLVGEPARAGVGTDAGGRPANQSVNPPTNIPVNPAVTDQARGRGSREFDRARVPNGSVAGDIKRVPADSKSEVPPLVVTTPARDPATAVGGSKGEPPAGRAAVENPAPPPAAVPARTEPIPVAGTLGATPPRPTSPVTPAGVSGDDPALRAAERALLCESPVSAATALNGQIASDPARQIPALYRPRDATDKSALDALSSLLKDTQRLRATARAIRNEVTDAGCEWVMGVDLTWTNAFGQPRRRSVQLRAVLQAVAGAAHVRRIFGASGF